MQWAVSIIVGKIYRVISVEAQLKQKNKGMGKKMNSIGNYACKSWINSMEVICHRNKISS